MFSEIGYQKEASRLFKNQNLPIVLDINICCNTQELFDKNGIQNFHQNSIFWILRCVHQNSVSNFNFADSLLAKFNANVSIHIISIKTGIQNFTPKFHFLDFTMLTPKFCFKFQFC